MHNKNDLIRPGGTIVPPFLFTTMHKMIDRQLIETLANEAVQQQELFLVDLKITASNEIEILIDGFTPVMLVHCTTISKQIEAQLDRETEDFQLTVASAGIGYPITMPQQFNKTIGKTVDILTKDSRKIIAVLKEYNNLKGTVTITYQVKEKPEGAKRKMIVDKVEILNIADDINKIVETII